MSAWGYSWGTAWGNSWGSYSQPATDGIIVAAQIFTPYVAKGQLFTPHLQESEID